MPPQLPTRKLGKNGPEITALGLGLMGISSVYGEVPPEAERLQVLDRAYELGQDSWDSADIYGDCEDLIGKWFAKTGKRNDIFLATKFGFKSPDGEVPDFKRTTMDSSGPYVKKALAKSLKRLGTTWVDLYYCHRVDEVTPIEETVKAMAELKRYLSFTFYTRPS
jgi:aryl-alcohol dehydrogenase-like predicted oxidoreductase